MQLIVISGPSGSGKTTLSKRILKKIKNGIILNTDNYYRTGILSQILSRTITSYFDRKISFNFGLFKRDLEFIVKNGFSDFYYKYNFKSKSIKKVYQNTKNIKFLIVEGIFGQEILKTLSSLLETGILTVNDVKKELITNLKFRKDNIVSKLDLVSREEFEALKKLVEKQDQKIKKLMTKTKRAKKS